MANILIIDDEKTVCDLLSHVVKHMGHEVTYALSLEEGLKEVSSKTFDVVFLDARLPDGGGLKALPKIIEGPLSPEVIIMTDQGDPDGAELAIKSGAWAYIEKPVTTQRMTLPLVRALQYRAEKAPTKPATVLKREGIVGSSPQLQECLDLLAHEARASVSRESRANGAPGENDHPAKGLPRLKDVREAALSKAETQYLERLVMVTQKDIKEACQISGLSRSRLYHLLQKYRITRA